MPLGPGVRYRFSGSGKGRKRLAFRGNKVIEVTPWPGGGKKGASKRVGSRRGGHFRRLSGGNPGHRY